MKRLLILLGLGVFIANAQQTDVMTNTASEKMTHQKAEKLMIQDKAPTVSVVQQGNAVPASKSVRTGNRDLNFVQIGKSQYGLQTNASVARRVKVYADGKISAVWTTSPDGVPWNLRGSGYNHYDGSNWMTPPVESRIELNRTGWPNIESYDDGTTEIEYIVSHYAEAGGGSGGYSMNNNDAIGSSNWNETELDKGNGPIWPRIAVSGDYLHIFGNYSDTLVVKSGVKRPAVYTRYNLKTKQFVDNKITLPGYDDDLYSYGSADNYSIAAKDNYVAVLVAPHAQEMVLWKSDDYGDTWEMNIIDSLTLPEPKFLGDSNFFWYSDGSCNIFLDDQGTVHGFHGAYYGFTHDPSESGSWRYFFTLGHGVHYFNDVSVMDSVLVRDTVWTDSTIYKLYVDGKKKNILTYYEDTAWTYSYDTITKTMDSTAMKAMHLQLYENESDPYNPSTDKFVWPIYYRYNFDTSGNKIDSTLVLPVKTVTQDSFTVEVVDQVVSYYNKFKTYPNHGRIPTTQIYDEKQDDAIYLTPETYNRNNQGAEYLQGGKYGSTSISSLPIGTMDDNGNIFLIFSLPVDSAIAPINFECYRDVYITYSKDGGQTWAESQNITKNPFAEDVFATLAAEVDDNLHIVFQEDLEPGTQAQNEDGPQVNDIYYVKVPVADVLNDVIGPATNWKVSIAENNPIDIQNAYPNPFTHKTRVEFNLKTNANMNINLVNMMGQSVYTDQMELNAGDHFIDINGNDLAKGVYLLQLNADGASTTYKLILE